MVMCMKSVNIINSKYFIEFSVCIVSELGLSGPVSFMCCRNECMVRVGVLKLVLCQLPRAQF